MVWYSHLFKNFPQFIVIHTVKGFGIVNKAEIDVFLKLSCFFYDPADDGNSISGSNSNQYVFKSVFLAYKLHGSYFVSKSLNLLISKMFTIISPLKNIMKYALYSSRT